MSKCGYCGQGNGGHAPWCPASWSSFSKNKKDGKADEVMTLVETEDDTIEL